MPYVIVLKVLSCKSIHLSVQIGPYYQNNRNYKLYRRRASGPLYMYKVTCGVKLEVGSWLKKASDTPQAQAGTHTALKSGA